MMIVCSHMHSILSTCLWSICYHESFLCCVYMCVGQRGVMQYSAMDQTLTY